MARKNLSEPAPGEAAPAPEAEPPRGSARLQAPRFSIQLTDGDTPAIDLAKMHPASREKLVALLKQGDTLKQLGVLPSEVVTAATPDPAASALDTMLGHKAVELVGLLAVIGAKRAGYADEHAQLMAFNVPQREALAPVVVRILGKYNLLGGKYAEELAALALAAGFLADNFTNVKNAAEKQGSLPLAPAV